MALKLPTLVVSRTDVSRLGRELETFHNVLHQEQMHPKGEKVVAPKVSDMLSEAATINKLDLLKLEDRRTLAEFLAQLKKQAPTIHMSFAAQAPPNFVQKVITWLRSEIHPLILLDIGLQPTIAAGCVIRTTNKYFDCSMGQNLRRNRGLLVKALSGVKQ